MFGLKVQRAALRSREQCARKRGAISAKVGHLPSRYSKKSSSSDEVRPGQHSPGTKTWLRDSVEQNMDNTTKKEESKKNSEQFIRDAATIPPTDFAELEKHIFTMDPSEPLAQPSTLSSKAAEKPSFFDTLSNTSTTKSSNLSSLRHTPADRGSQLTRIKSHQFFVIPESDPAIRHVVAPPGPLKPVMSAHSRRIVRRLTRVQADSYVEPVAALRYYGARPYKRDVNVTASRHSRFKREGIRHMESVHIRYQAPGLDESREQAIALFDR